MCSRVLLFIALFILCGATQAVPPSGVAGRVLQSPSTPGPQRIDHDSQKHTVGRADR